MPIYKVIYKDVEGDTNELIDKAQNVNELAKRHSNMLSAATIVDDKQLRYAHYKLVALFHNILNIASIGIRLTDRWEEFTEEELSEISTLIEVLEDYTKKVRDYLSVMGVRDA